MTRLTDHPILPPREFQQLRNSVEFWDWFLSKKIELDEYHQGQQSTISDDEDFLDRFLWSPNACFFWHEVRPIAHCARAGLFSDKACIKISTECESYDAVVIDNLTDDQTFVEATATVDGQDEKMNFRHRRNYGRSPAFQKIKYDGTKNTGYSIPNVYESDDRPIATSTEEIFEKLWATISKRIRAKERKDYPDGTWLTVSFEDFLTFGSEGKMAGLLEDSLATEYSGKSQFHRIILAGCEGRILIDADNGEETKTSTTVLTF